MDTKFSWEQRMPHESVKAFTYFNTFLALGVNRSLEKVRQAHGCDISIAQLKRYSPKYHWFERAEQYDIYKLKEKQARLKEEQEDYFDERLTELEGYHKLTDETMRRLLNDLQQGSLKTISVANSLKNLTDANMTNTKLALRFLGLPETINDTQDLNVEADVESRQDVTYNVDRSSDEFFNKQLELINNMIESKKDE